MKFKYLLMLTDADEVFGTNDVKLAVGIVRDEEGFVVNAESGKIMLFDDAAEDVEIKEYQPAAVYTGQGNLELL